MGEWILPDRDAMTAQQRVALHDGAAVAAAEVGVVELVGTGALQCMQGLLTNDLETPGEHTFVYGAVLTPKGMIVCDLWVGREPDRLTLYAPTGGHDDLVNLLRRSVPPRLAQVHDRSADRALRLVGPEAVAVAQRAGIEVPDAGHVASGTLDKVVYSAARPPEPHPFALQVACDAAGQTVLLTALEGAGATPAPEAALDMARILAGWPKLGAEIAEKTLPQEVRYDEIGGVSYSKGCYTGQETVSRLHFRGHTNRRTVGLRWHGVPPDAATSDVEHEGKKVGRVSSVAWLDDQEVHIGLGVVRRAVEVGVELMAAGSTAHIVELPFDL